MTKAENEDELTPLLRSSEDPFWRRLRGLLREKGIDPETTVLEGSFEDGDCLEYGVVRLADGSRYEYDIHYEDMSLEEAPFSMWKRL